MNIIIDPTGDRQDDADRTTDAVPDWDEMVCVACGATVIDDGTDAALGWIGGDEGWFCPAEPPDEAERDNMPGSERPGGAA